MLNDPKEKFKIIGTTRIGKSGESGWRYTEKDSMIERPMYEGAAEATNIQIALEMYRAKKLMAFKDAADMEAWSRRHTGALSVGDTLGTVVEGKGVKVFSLVNAGGEVTSQITKYGIAPKAQ